MNAPTDYIDQARIKEIEGQIALGRFKSADRLLAAFEKELPGHTRFLDIKGLICEQSNRTFQSI